MRATNVVERTDPLVVKETLARDFLCRLKDAVGSDAEAQDALADFTDIFAAMRAGRSSPNTARNQAVNVLNDLAPAVIDDFLAVVDACIYTDAWAGVRRSNSVAANGAMLAASTGREGDLEQGGAGPGARTVGAAHDANTLTTTVAPRKSKPKDWRIVSKSLVPYGRGTYAIWFTILNMSVIVGLFAYMAGDFASYVRENESDFIGTDSSAEEQQRSFFNEIIEDSGKVPEYTHAWIRWTPTWQTFRFAFLRIWGGRWGPSLRDGRWWLWFTSIYVHRDLQHVVSNMLLFVAMSVHLELNYGWWRLLIVWFASGIGANFISATFESYCTLLVGASGAVFGFMGLFVADLVVNFESIAWPFVRAFTIFLFLIFFVVNAIIENSRDGRVSHASHIGGLICGLFPSFLFLPNLRDKRLAAVRREMLANGSGVAQATEGATENTQSHGLKPSFWSSFAVNPLRIFGVVVVVVVYIILPIYLYQSKLNDDGNNCGQDSPDEADMEPMAPDASGVDLALVQRRLMSHGPAFEQFVRLG